MHLQKCIRVYLSNVPDFFLQEELDEYVTFMQKNLFPHWVVVVGNQIIGSGGIYEAKDEFVRKEFDNEVGFAWGMIHRNYHNQGFGKALANHRINYLLKNYPNRPIVLRTTQHTSEFFEKFGFQMHKMIKNGFGRGLDKRIMVYNPDAKKSM